MENTNQDFNEVEAINNIKELSDSTVLYAAVDLLNELNNRNMTANITSAFLYGIKEQKKRNMAIVAMLRSIEETQNFDK